MKPNKLLKEERKKIWLFLNRKHKKISMEKFYNSLRIEIVKLYKNYENNSNI